MARTAEPLIRKALAERLGIELGASRPDHLDALFVDPTALTEAILEALFGLVDTTRDVLSEGKKLGDGQSQITAWNLNGVEWGRMSMPTAACMSASPGLPRLFSESSSFASRQNRTGGVRRTLIGAGEY